VIALRARAKLTWYLEITGLRADGLHDLRSEMLTIDLADILVLDEAADYVRVFNPFAVAIPEDSTNIVARALALVGRTAGVTIEKSIPVGGGLGGGSADAAAILRWAGGASAQQALTLGADVPFCQLGGRALVEGAGERLTPLSFEERRLTLIQPSFGVDTADCYRAYDELRAGGWSPSGRNHLELPACTVEPRLRATMQWLRAELAPGVQLAGSGSTMFVEGLVEGRPRDAPGHWDVESPEGTLRFLQTITTPPEA
jgi:4-diphosphocytidyl-2-C-methyl-D-erythritol kinase